jgi:hypothetical protein
MHGHDLALSAAENYRAFAEDAHGRSPAYELLAGSVADDAAVLRFLGSLPPESASPTCCSRQPATCWATRSA